MSNRAGYSDDLGSEWAMIRWRGQVASSIRGKRGQAFLKELVVALDAIPTRRLIQAHLRQAGEVCALGAVGAARGMDLEKFDVEDHEILAIEFGIAGPLIREIEYLNDETYGTPEHRWQRMRSWAIDQIKPPPSPTDASRQNP